jgi:nitroreductase
MFTDIQIQTFNQILQARRSIHPPSYNGQIIENSIIEKILENATLAPNHGLTEPWQFVVFEGNGRQKLADFQTNLFKSKNPNPDEFKLAKLQKMPLMASHIIAIGMKRQEIERIPEIEEIEAVACAVQNMYLTATAFGLGSYWNSGGITYYEEAKEFFGLNLKDKLLGFFYIGKIDQSPPAKPRTNWQEKTKWISN